MDEVKGSYGGRINFVYIEIGSPDGKESAKEHGVMGTPTILLFDREGNHFYTIQGVQPRPVLEKVLDKLLAED